MPVFIQISVGIHISVGVPGDVTRVMFTDEQTLSLKYKIIFIRTKNDFVKRGKREEGDKWRRWRKKEFN